MTQPTGKGLTKPGTEGRTARLKSLAGSDSQTLHFLWDPRKRLHLEGKWGQPQPKEALGLLGRKSWALLGGKTLVHPLPLLTTARCVSPGQ